MGKTPDRSSGHEDVANVTSELVRGRSRLLYLNIAVILVPLLLAVWFVRQGQVRQEQNEQQLQAVSDVAQGANLATTSALSELASVGALPQDVDTNSVAIANLGSRFQTLSDEVEGMASVDGMMTASEFEAAEQQLYDRFLRVEDAFREEAERSIQRWEQANTRLATRLDEQTTQISRLQQQLKAVKKQLSSRESETVSRIIVRERDVEFIPELDLDIEIGKRVEVRSGGVKARAVEGVSLREPDSGNVVFEHKSADPLLLDTPKQFSHGGCDYILRVRGLTKIPTVRDYVEVIIVRKCSA